MQVQEEKSSEIQKLILKDPEIQSQLDQIIDQINGLKSTIDNIDSRIVTNTKMINEMNDMIKEDIENRQIEFPN